MTALELPSDVDAERVVVGVSIDSPQAARFTAGLEAHDFTVAVHRRLYAAALACPLPFRCDGSRTRAIAVAADVPFETAEEIRSSIPTLDDRTGWWMRRVREATRCRRLMAEVADLHDALGRGVALVEATAALEHCLAVAAGEVVGVLAGPEAVLA